MLRVLRNFKVTCVPLISLGGCLVALRTSLTWCCTAVGCQLSIGAFQALPTASLGSMKPAASCALQKLLLSPIASLRAGSLLRLQSEACSCVMQEMCKQCGRPGTVWEVLLADKSIDRKVVTAASGGCFCRCQRVAEASHLLTLLRLEVAKHEKMPTDPTLQGKEGNWAGTCRL